MDAPIELLFSDLVRLMTGPSGPSVDERPWHGVVSAVSEPPGDVGWFAMEGEPPPAFVRLPHDDAAGQRSLVWRDGALLRIEDGAGRPAVIVGAEHCWVFDASGEPPVQSPVRAVQHLGDAEDLLLRRDVDSFLGDDFTRPTGPVTATTFLGRAAWSVELAPPAHKPHPLQLIVDAATGFVLQQRNDGFGTWIGWVELAVADSLDPALFSWDGPVRRWEDERAAQRAVWRAEEESRLAWFTDHVAAAPVTVEVAWDVRLHRFDEDGSFEATLGRMGGSLARRLQQADPAWELHWQEVQHRWTAGGWDWAFSTHGDALTEAGLRRLKSQLVARPAPG